MTEQVKPCPFCGVRPILNDPDFIYPQGRPYKQGDTLKQLWSANCDETIGGCGCMVLADSKEEALFKWNTRAS